MEKPAETQFPIHDVLRRRWSPRAYSDRMVEPEKLKSLFEAARWAPSSNNEQPWHFIVGTKTGLYISYDGGDDWAGPCFANTFTTQRQDTTGLVLRDLGTTTQMIVAIGTRGFQTTVQPDLNQNGANGIYRGTDVNTGGSDPAWTTFTKDSHYELMAKAFHGTGVRVTSPVSGSKGGKPDT